jgi:hypothetical protein
MSEAIRTAFQLRHGVQLLARLGSGRDGEVYLTDRNTAVKFFTVVENYLRERSAYERLARPSIELVAGHAVPLLLRADNELRAIEMKVVQPPFLLDFASAYDEADVPDFPDEVWEEWLEQKREEFGERWADVDAVLAEFTRLTGLVMLDVNPGNVRFADETRP